MKIKSTPNETFILKVFTFFVAVNIATYYAVELLKVVK